MSCLRSIINGATKSHMFKNYSTSFPLSQFTQLKETNTKMRLKPIQDPQHYTDYEIVHNPEEWKYVERLMPVKWIPEPKNKPSFPSGWKPQTAEPGQYPYFVERTKNHMLPVYLDITERGMRRITTIRKIEGDIWKFSEELEKYLKPLMNYCTIGVKVEEMKRTVFLRGDYYEYTKKFLIDKGF